MMSRETSLYFRRFAQTIMVVDAIALTIGILLHFSYSFIGFFGGMAAGFLIAEVFIVHRAIECIERRVEE
jgi:hypothetical protein